MLLALAIIAGIGTTALLALIAFANGMSDARAYRADVVLANCSDWLWADGSASDHPATVARPGRRGRGSQRQPFRPFRTIRI